MITVSIYRQGLQNVQWLVQNLTSENAGASIESLVVWNFWIMSHHIPGWQSPGCLRLECAVNSPVTKIDLQMVRRQEKFHPFLMFAFQKGLLRLCHGQLTVTLPLSRWVDLQWHPPLSRWVGLQWHPSSVSVGAGLQWPPPPPSQLSRVTVTPPLSRWVAYSDTPPLSQLGRFTVTPLPCLIWGWLKVTPLLCLSWSKDERPAGEAQEDRSLGWTGALELPF